jgi:beta-glucanase (GH16 family)
MPRLLILSLVILFSCSKKSGTPSTPSPTNLVVNATVSTDNSGNVNFTASATNATSYEFVFGDGTYTSSTTGTATCKYRSSGTYTVAVTAKNAGGSISKNIDVTVNVVLSLIWSDDFDKDGAPDATRWGYDLGTGSNGWGNNELEYYTNRPDNAIVSNGTLKIIAKKENFSGSAYTSARMLTKDKFSFKYGKIEVKAKIPGNAGTWSAIWMLGNNLSTVGWPDCGEMDIMEHVGNQLNKIFGTFHYPGHSGANGSGSSTIVPDATTTFHRYALEWTPTTIKVMIDDNVFYTLTNNATLPFNQNFFIILNLAMGGNFGGTVDPAFSSAMMEVDWVKVYGN